MMLLRKLGLLFLSFLVFFACINFNLVYAKAANIRQVASATELEAAIHAGDSVELTKNIDILNTINLQNYNGVINGNGYTLKSINNIESMFNVAGGNFSFNNITLDGDNKSRIMKIHSRAVINIRENSVIKNGYSINDISNAEGGAIRINDSELNISNSTINNSVSVKNASVNRDQTESHGGAIYGHGAKINLDTVTFSSNRIGDDGFGQGGAIYVDGASTVNIVGSNFVNNHLFKKDVVTGGSIYAGNKSVINIGKNSAGQKTTFDIVGPFNTGGAIRLLDSSAVINDTDFVINSSNKDGYGISAGAIMSEGSSLVVNRSNFTVQTPTSAKLDFAGGFIGVVGEIKKFEVNDSTFIGRGKDNGNGLATYGGAICFESSSDNDAYTYGNAIIKGSTFKNLHADQWGGAIALTTRINEKNKVNLEIIDSRIDMTATQHHKDSFGGGAIAVGKGTSLTLTKTEVSQSKSNKGGAIYNQGSVTIDKGSSIWGALAYKLGGAIYNDGRLYVGNSTFVYNECGDWSMPNHPESLAGKPELMGKNIYAKKDVIVTPEANLADPRDGDNIRDVRVLDGESAILLTGPLNKKIKVSVSENVKTSEPQYRKVGYVVAKGYDGYVPSKEDAKFLHYVTKDGQQPASEYENHNNIGEWDYLLNPENNTVVLGQRIKLITHGNANGNDDLALVKFNSNNQSTKEEIRDVYKSVIPFSNINVERPIRNNYSFVNWYDTNVSDNDVANNPNNHLMKNLVDADGDITAIINPNVVNVYAGWNQLVNINVNKIWKNVPTGTTTPSVTIKLISNGKDSGKTLELNATNNYSGSFNNLPVYGSDGITKIKYTISEVSVANYNSQISGNADQGFTVTNTYNVAPVTETIKVKKVLIGRDFKDGDSFSFTLVGKDGAPMPEGTGNKVTVSNGDEASFKTITYSKAGQYKYEVSEEAGSIPGITYSTSKVEVVVNVVDENGVLKASVSYPEGMNVAEITNTYNVAPVTETIKVKKVLVGRDFKDGDEFEIVISSKQGSPLPNNTVIKVHDGTITGFDGVQYHEIGEYHYQIVEKVGNIKYIKYDEKIKEVVVKVLDDGSGKLKSIVEYENGKDYVEVLNKFESEPNPITPPSTIIPRIANNEIPNKTLPNTGEEIVLMDGWLGMIIIGGVLVFKSLYNKKY